MDQRTSLPSAGLDICGPSGPLPAFSPPHPRSISIGSERETESGRADNSPFLPPRRTSRTSLRQTPDARWSTSGDFRSPREEYDQRQQQTAPKSRSSSIQSSHRSGVLTPSVQAPDSNTPSRASSIREQSASSARASLETLHEYARPPIAGTTSDATLDRSSSLPSSTRRQRQRQSALRYESRLSDEDVVPNAISNGLIGVASSPSSQHGTTRDGRPYSHPPSRSATTSPPTDAWPPAPMAPSGLDPPSSPPSVAPSTRPTSSIRRLSSLHHIFDYRDERQAHDRESEAYSQGQDGATDGAQEYEDDSPTTPVIALPPTLVTNKTPSQHSSEYGDQGHERQGNRDQGPQTPAQHQSKFRHFAFEAGFCLAIAMTQFLCEYLISGFAIVLPHLLAHQHIIGSGSTGAFWPAALLTLLLSAMLLIFARISDMYGGYGPFMFGLFWLAIWTFIPGFYPTGVALQVSRAMQGLALAALNPAVFTMIGSFYENDKNRHNFVLGLYGACAPVGFYIGFLVGGALPAQDSKWFFIVAACASVTTAILAWICVPRDRMDRRNMDLSMDYVGAFFITAGLILVTYALTVEPYANQFEQSRNGFTFPIVCGPLASGTGCLLVALWVEGWYAKCPILPFDFFKPRGVFPLCIACLFFFASFGVWLYNSAEFFSSEIVTGVPGGMQGIALSIWYTPLVIGGIVLCVLNGWLSHRFHLEIILILSGLAWVGAPLIFAAVPFPLHYWYEVLPSMLFAALGIDLTYTATTIALSSSQPQKYQGIAGAVTSILVNLAMSFSLPISLIVQHYATIDMPIDTVEQAQQATLWGYKMAFVYGAASAGMGLLIAVVFMGRPWWERKKGEDEDVEMRPRRPLEATTLVHDVDT
ncbi:hypothetical protein B0A48_14011 [Cryoendolithus antarcticus]|uniref:Major facilitator superfamily (MFS) profile domain-containing protein n=1 Tax=Cryoendolithus antarcticus TaxID=1507870 RepID=A0A1V8SMC1_9PEZI|nr:hypothetical protein B0A48_14011 [Cryoendolithus antarcticus]